MPNPEASLPLFGNELESHPFSSPEEVFPFLVRFEKDGIAFLHFLDNETPRVRWDILIDLDVV